MEVSHAAVPRPRVRQPGAHQGQSALRRAMRPVAKRVRQYATRMAVGVAAVATHPSLVRQARVVEKLLPTLAEAELRTWTQFDCLDDASAAQVQNRKRIVERVNCNQVFPGCLDKSGRTTTHAHALVEASICFEESDLIHAGKRHR